MTVLTLALALLGQAPTLVPDDNFVPTEGDVVQIHRRERGVLQPADAALNLTAWQDLQSYSQAGNLNGVKRLEAEKALLKVESGVEVRVVELSREGVTRNPSQIVVSPDGRGTRVSGGSSQDPKWHFYVVKVLDGEHKDKEIYVDKEWVKKCRVVAPRVKTPAKAAAKKKGAAPKTKSLIPKD